MLRSGEMSVERVWKRFRPDRRPKRMRTFLDKRRADTRGRARRDWVWALRDVDFRIAPGESVGLIGTNGSGKSTLLKLLTRVMFPHSGRVHARGRTGALIEVASGIHPLLSGRENIVLYGTLLGLPRKMIAERFDAIVEFAEVGHAIDRQVKFYSSGMKMRLGFAVAAFLEPDILLVDEVLAVGDSSFQQRCLARMSEVHRLGTTLVYVSHDLPTVEASCERGLWLDKGVLLADGPIREVLGAYRAAIEERVEHEQDEHRGDEGVRVVEVVVEGPGGGPPRTGEETVVELLVSSEQACDTDLYLGLTEGPGTPILAVHRELLLPEGKVRARCTIPRLDLPGGRYYVWTGLRGKRGDLVPWGPAAAFDVVGPDLDPTPRGVVRLAPVYCPAEWSTEEA